jgi:hypothetical protein
MLPFANILGSLPLHGLQVSIVVCSRGHLHQIQATMVGMLCASPIGEFLHVDRILIDFGDDGISPILEDVDDVGGFDLCLLSTLLLLGPSHELELTPFIATLG